MAIILPKMGLFYGGQWHDESSRVLYRDRVRISRGARSEGLRSSPTVMGFSLKNGNGRFSVGDPTSPLFGVLGRNNPVRAYLGTPHPGAANFDDIETTAHVAPSVDAPTGDGLLLCAWAAPAAGSEGTYTTPGSMTTVAGFGGGSSPGVGGGQMRVASEAIGDTGPTGTRTATFSISEDYVAASVLLHGTNPAVVGSDTATQSDPTVELAGLSVGDWLVCFAYHGWLDIPDAAGQPPAFPTDLTEAGWILLADTGVIVLGDVDADNVRMRAWARRVRRAGTHTVRVDALGRTLICLVGVSGVGDWTLRGHAELVSMPPRRDHSGNDRWVPVEAAGVLRRLGASTAEPLDPALKRTASRDPAVFAYWPMDDIGPDTRRVASPVDGTPHGEFRARGVSVGPVSREIRWAPDDDSLAGSGRLPRVSSLFGQLRLTANIPTPSNLLPVGMSYWTRGYPVDGDGHSTFTQTTMSLQMVGSQVARWELITETRSPENTAGVENGLMNLIIEAYDEDGSLIDSSFVQDAQFDDRWQHAAMTVSQDGGDVRAKTYLNGVERDELVIAGTSLGRPAGARFEAFSTSISFVDAPNAAPVSFGHPAVLRAGGVDTLEAAIASLEAAGRGYEGEPAGRRVLRLCQEESIAAAAVGDPDQTVMMGAQRPVTLLDLLRECEDADHGILHEPREFVGLAYRTVGSLYNQDPIATLNFTDGEVAAPWEPTPDDRLIRNDVTVTREGGGSARSVQGSGPLNVDDPGSGDPEAVGRYPHNPTLSLANDVQTPGQARWLRLLGTQPEARFPSVAANLLREQVLSMNPALVQALANLDIGDKIIVQNPAPGDLPPDDVEQLWVGSDELLSQVDWDLSGNTVPATPYNIAVLEDDVLGIVQSDTATLDEDLDTTETALDVDAGGGPDWIHDGVDYDLIIGGERMTVTAVGAMSGTFPARKVTITVARSVNGVVKSHSTGARVEWFRKAYIGLGA